jgi:hypothetical protein
MLTARVSSQTILEQLTQSINVIDALEESENANWKEIVLLGFTYDQSDLTRFETVCHSSGRQTLTDARASYTLEKSVESTRIMLVTTVDGDCRITQAELQMTSANSLQTRKLGITLFAFSNTHDVLQQRHDEVRVAEVLQTLYLRHQNNPIPVYFIGHARPQHFNIPLMFSEMDKLKFFQPLSIIPASSTTLITHRLAESKAVLAQPPVPEAVPEHAAISDSKQAVPQTHRVYHRPYAKGRPHRFPRAHLKPVVRRHKENDENTHQQIQKRNPWV